MGKLYFIAEIGQNHQGQLSVAKQMVDVLVGSGVKAIKTAKRDESCFPEAWKTKEYNNINSFGKTYYEHRQALELSHKDFISLKNYIEDHGFDFIPSFTDIPSFSFLNGLNLKKIKIASQRTVDIKLLEYVSRNFPGTIFMSSGMSNIEHIDQMVNIFKKNKKFLMQCTSVYPCSNRLLNLRVLKAYRQRYKKLVNGFGFSGHHMSMAPDIAAYALGANIIERHFTLDRTWKGTDHKGSLEINEVKELIYNLKLVAGSLGDSRKYILPEEMPAAEKLREDLHGICG